MEDGAAMAPGDCVRCIGKSLVKKPAGREKRSASDARERGRQGSGWPGGHLGGDHVSDIPDRCPDDLPGDRGLLRRLYRQSLFSMVGVDALLAGHKDHALRERVHQAFAAKCKQAGLTASTDEGGSHEA